MCFKHLFLHSDEEALPQARNSMHLYKNVLQISPRHPTPVTFNQVLANMMVIHKRTKMIEKCEITYKIVHEAGVVIQV